MKTSCPKVRRVRLGPKAYAELHRLVLKRDSWQCQACGKMRHLQVHHLKPRSQLGSDIEQNLITLCTDCHARMHYRIATNSI